MILPSPLAMISNSAWDAYRAFFEMLTPVSISLMAWLQVRSARKAREAAAKAALASDHAAAHAASAAKEVRELNATTVNALDSIKTTGESVERIGLQTHSLVNGGMLVALQINADSTRLAATLAHELAELKKTRKAAAVARQADLIARAAAEKLKEHKQKQADTDSVSDTWQKP